MTDKVFGNKCLTLFNLGLVLLAVQLLSVLIRFFD